MKLFSSSKSQTHPLPPRRRDPRRRNLTLSGSAIVVGESVIDESASFVDESVVGGRPADEFLGLEPEGDLLGRRLGRVRPVDDIAPEIDAEVAANGTGKRLLRIRLPHHLTTGQGGVLALPNHRDNRSGGDEVDQLGVKRLVLQVDVMLADELFGSLHELHGDELESSLFESLDDVADESALNAVRLHHDESAVGIRHGEGGGGGGGNNSNNNFKQIETTQL